MKHWQILLICGFLGGFISLMIRKSFSLDAEYKGLKESKKLLEIIHKQRDSLNVALNQSVQREQRWILLHEADSLKADSLTVAIVNRERKIKTYEQRLKEVRQITIANPDSFLIKRYPQ